MSDGGRWFMVASHHDTGSFGSDPVVELPVDQPHTDAIDGKRKCKNKTSWAASSLSQAFSGMPSSPD
jgi:hypothetical protein